MSVKLLTEHHLALLSLKGGCIGSSVSTLGKMQHRWKSHVTAQMILLLNALFIFFILLLTRYRAHTEGTHAKHLTKT